MLRHQEGYSHLTEREGGLQGCAFTAVARSITLSKVAPAYQQVDPDTAAFARALSPYQYVRHEPVWVKPRLTRSIAAAD